ncbi:MAG: 1,4-dihydroxy-2-naphthoate octaprenyltransferase [Chloroflexi bacterium]|nr:1,4-dihydroxy-2-naphthoate octaprenyltransferase [Chloroflexota bacterium]
MNFSMWRKALEVIPRISKEEWDELDIISKWLIATRAAVLVMTFLSAAFAGIFAYRAGHFDLGKWALVTMGLLLAHATNNLLNDYTDYVKGVDTDNYYRAQYGPQPLVHGLLSKKELLTYAAVTGLLAASCGLSLVFLRGGMTLLLMGAGAFFVLLYTWPLKYIALGELAVLIVWGPLMIGGGYYVIAGEWDWNVIIASLPYALGVTSVIFGKHIDKFHVDKAKNIHTLPVVLGEKLSRYSVVGMFILQYLFTIYLTISGFFTPVMPVIFLALPVLVQIWPMFKTPKPDEKPADFPDVWPNYFVAGAFHHNRRFGVWFLLGVVADVILKLFVL